MPFLRPAAVADLARYEVCIPDTAEWRTQLWGAISLLLQSWQWEGDSSLSDEEIAEEYLKVLNSFERCPMLAGFVSPYGGANAPLGWLLCDGATYQVADYPELYAVIGNEFGGGVTEFRVPRIQGRFLQGAVSSGQIGLTGGEATHTLTEDEIPAHTHSLNETIIPTTPGAPTPTLGFSAVPTLQTNSAGGGEAHNNTPLFLKMHFMISTGQTC